MSNIHIFAFQQPTGYTPIELMAAPATEVENQGSVMSFRFWNITKRDSWCSELFSNFCLPALFIVLYIKDTVWVDRFVWAMIFLLGSSKGRLALQLLQEFFSPLLVSQQRASALKGRVFNFPFSLLAFVVTAFIEDAIWKKRFLWAIMNLVIVHLTVEFLKVHLEPIERALEPILNDFMSGILLWNMPTKPTAKPATEVKNQGSRMSLGVLPVPFFYLAFQPMVYYNHNLNDRHMWAMILVFTFYMARQAFPLVHELLTVACLSQWHAPTDNQSFGTSFGVLEVVSRWMRKHFINRGLLALRALDIPFSWLAFIIMALMDDSNWKDRYLGAIMSTLWLSAICQLVHLFLAMLAVSRYLKQRVSPLTNLASDLPSSTLTESIIKKASSSLTRASLSSKPRSTYDVFLSFYGKDCRCNFVHHLHTALQQKGILVYKDDENLEQGKDTCSELLKAIQQAKCVIIVFSKNYASSKWCLRELTHIMKCMMDTQLEVFPIFYYVDPSHVQNQKGSFADAFDKHMKNGKVSEEERKAWRVALKKVSGLVGWDVDDRCKANVIDDICRTILIRLCGNLSNFSNNLVGMGSRVENMTYLLGMNEDKFLGICGTGGIGKTTLAKFIFDRLSSEFEASFFLCVKEGTQNEGDLQKQLILEIFKENGVKVLDTCERFYFLRKIWNKKVLIVFDNVEEGAQIKEIIGWKDLLHQGSKILITCSNRQLLKGNLKHIYEVEELECFDALQLFSWMAFKKSHLNDNYLEMSRELVTYTGGIPLVVEVFGSSLCFEPVNVWKSALDHLKSHRHAEIVDKLEISFKGLEDVQKEIFLDIAFFFNGSLEYEVIDILDSCGYHPGFNIGVLRDKSLIKISEDNRIRVHDLLVKMGKQIVYKKSLEKLGKRSRLYLQEDIISMMKENIGTSMVEGFVLELPLKKREQLSLKAFSMMKNLRILLIKNKSCYPETKSRFLADLHTLEWEGESSNFDLSNNLCVITWLGYPLKSLPCSFQLDNLVKLQMPHSCIEKLWEGTKVFGKLKKIDLRYSKNLIETPNFGGVPNLEKLVLSFCTSLSTVHSSIRFVKHLQVLKLEGCNCLKELPENENGWECLRKLDIRGTALRNLASISFSTKLRILSVGGSESNPTSFWLPTSFSRFSSLERLNMSYCNISDAMIFPSLDCLASLKALDLKGNRFTRIPDSISQLSNLRGLVLDNCSNLQVLPKLPVILRHFSVRNCTLFKELYSRMYAWTSSEVLLTGGFSALAMYVGYCGKPYMSIYLHPQELDLPEIWMLEGVSWGVTMESKIPKWFNQRGTNLYGTIQTQMIVDDHPTSSVRFENCLGYALFIVYQVHELDICQREIKDQNAYEYESSNSGTHNGSNPVFPEFVCQLQVSEVGLGPSHESEEPEESEESEDSDFLTGGARQLELNEVGPATYDKFQNSCVPTKKAQKLEPDRGDPGLSFVFRIAEVVPVGSNGVWLFISSNCFRKEYASNKRCCLGVSVTSKSTNVKVMGCGAGLVPRHDPSAFKQVVNSISPQCLDEVRLQHILSPNLLVQSFMKGLAE